MLKPAKPRLTVVGNINMDMVLQAERLPTIGQTLLAHDLRKIPGGKGANQAVAAARLGAQVALVGRVGGDEVGPVLLEHLAAEGIDISAVRSDDTAATGTAFVTVLPDGQNGILSYLGANLLVTPADIDAAAAHFRASDLVLIQLGIPLPTVEYVLQRCHSWGIPTFLDLGPIRGPLGDFWKLATIASPNETELACILPEARWPDCREALQQISRQGPAFLLKQGADGCCWLDAGQVLPVPAIKALPVVDTTGAGDAFAAAFAVQYAAGRDLAASLRYANLIGACAASRLGAQSSFPRLTEVDEALLVS